MIQGHHEDSLPVPASTVVVVGCDCSAALVAGALVGTTLIDGRVVWAALVTASLVGGASVVAAWAGSRRAADEAALGGTSRPPAMIDRDAISTASLMARHNSILVDRETQLDPLTRPDPLSILPSTSTAPVDG